MPIESSRATSRPGTIPDEELSEDAASGKQTAAEENDELHARLMVWLQQERDRQAENRMQMAIDADFYDGEQWSEDDRAVVEARGQPALTFNEVRVGIEWMSGSEKRERTDWRVLPREEGDTEAATTKTKVMKYIADVNRVHYARSDAFKEAAISGLSWLEDSLSGDATADVLHCGMESWRNVLHDSFYKRPDGRDMRHLFRWRILDLDIAKAMFKGNDDALKRASAGADQLFKSDSDELWYLGDRLSQTSSAAPFRRTVISESVSDIFNRRERVKVYECWYREPAEMDVMKGGAYHGEVHDPKHEAMNKALASGDAEVIKSTILRVRVAYFTDSDLLGDFETPFAHNDFPFTPISCFRRGRDGMHYGFIRNVRDPQEDLNKRMSKSLFLLSVNQLITEVGAFSDQEGDYTLQDAIDNVSNPQGVFVMKDGSKKFEIRRDYAEEESQMRHVTLDRSFIQTGGGVTDELLGRKTNAVSGSAIHARQDQGSATTGTIFDAFRLAIQLSGSKTLSNAERFYSGPKVIRLTELKGKIDWVRVNQPEVQADGSVRFLNDITASRADFIVDEQDFRASMRESMFEKLSEMVSNIAKYQPMFAISMLDLVVDVADFPGKEEMVDRLKGLIAEARAQGQPPQPTPEQQAEQAEIAELKKRELAAKIGKDEAASDKADAEADQIRATLNATMTAIDLTRTPQGAPVAGAPGSLPTVPSPTAQGGQGTPPLPGGPGIQPDPVMAMLAQIAKDMAALKSGVAAALDGVASLSGEKPEAVAPTS